MSNAIPNPNIGDVIKVTLNSGAMEKASGVVCAKRELVKGNPAFTSYSVKIGKRKIAVSYSPLIDGFHVPDHTD